MHKIHRVQVTQHANMVCAYTRYEVRKVVIDGRAREGSLHRAAARVRVEVAYLYLR